MAHRKSLGFARDDKKERVVERERTVVQGESSCWDGRDAPSPSTTAFSNDSDRFCAKAKKVTGSQDDGFVGGLEITGSICSNTKRSKKSQAPGMTKERTTVP
jgi:hypothetical protein